MRWCACLEEREQVRNECVCAKLFMYTGSLYHSDCSCHACFCKCLPSLLALMFRTCVIRLSVRISLGVVRMSVSLGIHVIAQMRTDYLGSISLTCRLTESNEPVKPRKTDKPNINKKVEASAPVKLKLF